jgi:predicted peptidase
MSAFKLSVFTALVFCLSSLHAEDFSAEVYKSGSEELPYRIHLPKSMDKSKKYPLVIFLHGAGERGNENKKQLAHGAKDILKYSRSNNEPVIIIAPQCPKKKQWVNTPWGKLSHTMPKEPSIPMALAISLLKSKVNNLPVDVKRVYVSGLSMGGYGTWDIIQRMPDYFAAAIPVCGGGDSAEAPKLKNLPIWCFHGGNDRVVKTKRSQDMIAAIKKAGGSPKYTEYPGVGHNSWSATFSNKEVLKWLFEQKKK